MCRRNFKLYHYPSSSSPGLAAPMMGAVIGFPNPSAKTGRIGNPSYGCYLFAIFHSVESLRI